MSGLTTVWIVTEPSYDYTDIHGVFKTVQGAQDAFPKHTWILRSSRGFPDYYVSDGGLDITEYELHE